MSMRDFFLQIILHFIDKIWDLVVILLFRLQIILLFVGGVIFGVAVLWPRPTYQRWIAGILSAIMLAGTIILSRNMIAGPQEPLPRIGAKKEGETDKMPPPKRDHVALPQARHDQEKFEREKDNTLREWPHQECRRATEPDEKFSNDKPSDKDELIKNPNFEHFYQPAWSAEIHDRNANIHYRTLSLSHFEMDI
jgi:hypothetical protein